MILGQGVEHEFDPGRYPQFLENLEQMVLDGMLAKLQLLGNLAVRQAVTADWIRESQDQFRSLPATG